jgi:hypothetical protein
MTASQFNPADLLGLSDLKRKIVTHLLRKGLTHALVLAQAVDVPLPDAQDALDELVRQGTVLVSDDGQYQVRLGRSRHRTLPPKLWRSLLTSDRLYSDQEIATLNTSIPFLQFARARLGQFADHGYGHALRVKSFATQLGYLVGLTQTERHLLRAAALFHDVGNAVDRSKHNSISQQAVLDLTASGELPFTQSEAELIGLLCRWHRGEYEPDRRDRLDGELIHTGFLASILRVSDALDIDQRRFDYTERLMRVLEYFYPQELPFWTSHTEILGVRIQCRPDLALQVFVREEAEIEKNVQIIGLREDLRSTPLDWSIELIPVRDAQTGPASARAEGPALMVFPFEPHSLVMAALTHRQLCTAGAHVELFCYPDTPGGSAWLWQVLSELSPECYARLVVIGDRPDPMALQARQSVVERWQQASARVSLLNRHEGNWSALYALRRVGAEIILGSDWAFFSGQNVGRLDLAWGRIAALCTRDPTLPVVGLALEEMAVTRGLLKTVYDAASRPADDSTGWSALAEPILDRIAGNDRDAGWNYFLEQSADFSSTWGRVVVPSRVAGRVLLFEDSPSVAPQSNYWVLEAAIEAHGRTLERGISFNSPYAMAVRHVENDIVELLAINHWREEKAIPIRLLCPPDLDPPPAGHEGCVLLALPARRAQVIVQSLIDACNQSVA